MRNSLGGGRRWFNNGNYEPLHNVLFLFNAFWSDGGSHYLVSDGPISSSAERCGNRHLSFHGACWSGLAGLEWIASKKLYDLVAEAN